MKRFDFRRVFVGFKGSQPGLIGGTLRAPWPLELFVLMLELRIVVMELGHIEQAHDERNATLPFALVQEFVHERSTTTAPQRQDVF